MNDMLYAIGKAGRLCDVCRFNATCRTERWALASSHTEPPCAVQMPDDWVDDAKIYAVYNEVVHSERPLPKFNVHQMVKYRVGSEVRYNNITCVVWNPSLQQYVYQLEEPLAMPIYREWQLELVNDEEKERMYRAIKEDRLILNRKGYLTVKGDL